MRKASHRRCLNDSNEDEVDECAMDYSRFASSQVIYERKHEAVILLGSNEKIRI